jgi:hypothetical protein
VFLLKGDIGVHAMLVQEFGFGWVLRSVGGYAARRAGNEPALPSSSAVPAGGCVDVSIRPMATSPLHGARGSDVSSGRATADAGAVKPMTHRSADDFRAECIAKMDARLGTIYYRLYTECVHLHLKWAEYVELYGVNAGRSNCSMLRRRIFRSPR